MVNIKGFVKEYDELISKLVTVILWFGIGGMVGYMMGAYKVFTMVIK